MLTVPRGGVTLGSITAQTGGGYSVGLPEAFPYARVTAAIAAGRIFWTHFTTQQAITVSEVHVRVTTAAAASTVLVAIYAVDSAGRPGARLFVTPTAYDSTTAGKKSSVGLTVALPPGRYATAILAVGGAPTMLVMNCADAGGLSDGNHPTLDGVQWVSNSTTNTALTNPAPTDLLGLSVGGGVPMAPVFLRWTQ